MSNKDFMQYFIDGLNKSGQYALSLHFQKQMMMDSLLEKREREQLVNDVAHEVLSRLSATVDVSDIVDDIDELRRALEKFYDDYR